MRAMRKQNDGFTLVEVAMSVSILAVGLLSVSALLFRLDRASTGVQSDYAGHQVLVGRLNEARQEFNSASLYLEKYSDPVTFTLPPGLNNVFDNASGSLRAEAVIGSPNCIVLKADLSYSENGQARTDDLEFYHRCEFP